VRRVRPYMPMTGPQVYSLGRRVRATLAAYERAHATHAASMTPQSLEDALIAKVRRRAGGITGDERLVSLLAAIDLMAARGTDFPLPPFHYRAMMTIVRSITPRMYGDGFQEAIPALMRRFGMRDTDAFRQQVFIEMPRRWGKTVLVAIFVACYLYSQPSASVNIYSTTFNISKEMADKVVTYIRRLGELMGRKVEYAGCNNVDKKEFRNMYGGVSTLKTYAAGGEVCQPTRGMAVVVLYFVQRPSCARGGGVFPEYTPVRGGHLVGGERDRLLKLCEARVGSRGCVLGLVLGDGRGRFYQLARLALLAKRRADVRTLLLPQPARRRCGVPQHGVPCARVQCVVPAAAAGERREVGSSSAHRSAPGLTDGRISTAAIDCAAPLLQGGRGHRRCRRSSGRRTRRRHARP